MSTLEKTINLLQEMPEQKLEAVYMYVRFVNAQTEEASSPKKDASSIAGLAKQYANTDMISLEKEAFANAMVEKHAID
ncbi:MAG: hypothetical protein NC355_00185 [Blautia sp.]|nr:hypothetical protein [Blautia sp.]